MRVSPAAVAVPFLLLLLTWLLLSGLNLNSPLFDRQLRAEVGFLNSRTQVLAGAQYRFGI